MKNSQLFKVVLLCCLFSPIAFAQEDEEDEDGNPKAKENIVYIDKLEENPQDLSFFVIQLPIWHLAGSKINTSILDLKGDISYIGKSRFNSGLSYKYGMGDKIAPDTYEFTDNLNKGLIMSVNEVPKSQELELRGTFYFAENLRDIDETIKLKQVGNVNYVTTIKTKELVRTGINFSYSQGFTWYNMNNVELKFRPLASPTEQNERLFSDISMSTIQDYKFIKFGVSRSKAVSLKINAKGYGDKEVRRISVKNFNVIYAVQNKFDDVFVGTENTNNNTVELVRYSMDSWNQKLPFGFEFTGREVYKKSFVAFDYGIKYLPGLLKNINLMVTFGVSLNFDLIGNK